MLLPFFEPSALAVSLGIVLLSFISEDAATVSSALLVLGGPIAWPVGFVSCFFGIWAGDIGLYSAARFFGKPILHSLWIHRLANEKAVARCEEKFRRHSMLTLFASRFVPGTRLPTYLAAGLFAMPVSRFVAVTGIGALIWIGGIFGLTRLFGSHALEWFASIESRIAPVAITAIVVIGTMFFGRSLVRKSVDRGAIVVRRWLHWEFWPAWLFYLPVVVYYLYLGVRHRSFSLPSAANPGIATGGLVGESKCAILDELRRVNGSRVVAEGYLLDGNTVTDRLLSLHRICREHEIELPFVLKPDFGQRGHGVKLIRNMRTALGYLERVDAPVLVQRYAPGPHEVGIFYYRFPGEERGKIFSITEKIFPVIVGDGVRTIKELIAADERASLIARTYLRRFAGRRKEVLGRGQILPLVEAGNHAQGCIFRDGRQYWTPALEDAIDRISRIRGFFIGRYDIRFSCETDLKEGHNFEIIELNGASAEATHIYDARNSLRSAYRTLFEQWRLVFAIGAANRASGHPAASLMTLWQAWRRYSAAAETYPLAD